MSKITYPESLVQSLPSKERKPRPYGRYAVHAEQDGLDVRFGRTVSNLERALDRAQRESLKHGYTTVQDYTRPVAQRLVALFRRGIPVYIEGEDLS